MYDGTIASMLEGDNINERALIGSALNIAAKQVERGPTL
jgi:ribose transport system ATP-binding protein